MYITVMELRELLQKHNKIKNTPLAYIRLFDDGTGRVIDNDVEDGVLQPLFCFATIGELILYLKSVIGTEKSNENRR